MSFSYRVTLLFGVVILIMMMMIATSHYLADDPNHNPKPNPQFPPLYNLKSRPNRKLSTIHNHIKANQEPPPGNHPRNPPRAAPRFLMTTTDHDEYLPPSPDFNHNQPNHPADGKLSTIHKHITATNRANQEPPPGNHTRNPPRAAPRFLMTTTATTTDHDEYPPADDHKGGILVSIPQPNRKLSTIYYHISITKKASKNPSPGGHDRMPPPTHGPSPS